MEVNNYLNRILKMKAIAETGLLFSENAYDQERYAELRELSLEWLSNISDFTDHEIRKAFPLPSEYPTAKVDIRGMLLSDDNKILFVKESLDQKWSLPGGWADIGYSPTENIIKEFREETGIEVEVVRLLAVFDKKNHPHPPQPFYVYKMVFLCRAVKIEPSAGFDIEAVQFFDIGNLPPLSEDRILSSQISLVYQKIIDGDIEVYTD
jgi:ADP-ribose pyrophosphatase YjhB (NUDIX family)